MKAEPKAWTVRDDGRVVDIYREETPRTYIVFVLFVLDERRDVQRTYPTLEKAEDGAVELLDLLKQAEERVPGADRRIKEWAI